MKTGSPATLKLQMQLSILTILVGAALMIWMIVVESEPGAIPLLLIVVGGGWYYVTRRRVRAGNTRV